jgi:short-subunit dehydrogenase
MSQTSLGTAVVTGASAGIGAVYADRLARRGYDLLLVARTQSRLEANAEKIRAETGRKVEVLVADLSDPAKVSALSERIEADRAITLLVNNAGVTLGVPTLESPKARIENLLAVNIVAPTLLAVAAAKAFAARKAGTIINIASVLAFAPEMFEGVYSGSKAHLVNVTQGLAQSLKDTGVRVQAVLPGATRTEIWGDRDVDAALPGKVMDPGVLVDAALVGLDKGEVITIPPLADESLFTTYETARLAMGPFLSQRDAAPRYR